MKKITELNEEIYKNIMNTYYSDLEKICIEIYKQENTESVKIYNLVLRSVEGLHKWKFDLRFYYRGIMEEKSGIDKDIDSIISKSKEDDYIYLSELYNEWRKIMHKIWKYCISEFKQYISETRKSAIKLWEKIDEDNTSKELENLEKDLELI